MNSYVLVTPYGERLVTFEFILRNASISEVLSAKLQHGSLIGRVSECIRLLPLLIPTI